MVTDTKINEIFSSIQGEGPFAGYKQLFIRFCTCNLNCNYCDTKFKTGQIYTPQSLFEKISQEYNLKTFHSISLTGGEPLLSYKFLKEFLTIINKQTLIYLETNATLAKEFEQIKDFINIVSADIKLPSCTNGQNLFNLHEKFFQACKGINTFAKIVFDKNITEQEINTCTVLAQKYDLELILQPKMIGNKMAVSSEFCQEILDKFTQKHHFTRLIPQMHKFLDVQ